MFLSDTGNSEFGQCFPRNLTYQMNPVNLGSFFGVLQGPFEAPPKYLEVKRTLVRIWYLGSLSKISKFFFFFYVCIFIFGGAGSLLLRQAFSACSGQGLLSLCRVRASLWCLPLFWSTGPESLAQELWLLGSGAQAQHCGTWASCPMARGILPNQGSGMELVSPAVQAASFPLSPQGSLSESFKTPSQMES